MLRNIDNYKFEDLFDLSEIQKLIDSMSKALNMGIIIVSPEGKWITKPSSKCYFCEKLIKTSAKALRIVKFLTQHSEDLIKVVQLYKSVYQRDLWMQV